MTWWRQENFFSESQSNRNNNNANHDQPIICSSITKKQQIFWKVWCVSRFGTTCTILKMWKLPMGECYLWHSSLGVFHVLYMVQMVPNCAKHQNYFLIDFSQFSIYIPPENVRKTKIFLSFSGDIKIEHWNKTG